MPDYDHYAFLESMLEDTSLSFIERQDIEEQLSDYYQCLAELDMFEYED